MPDRSKQGTKRQGRFARPETWPLGNQRAFSLPLDLDKHCAVGSFILMTEAEQLQRDIDTLRESIQRGWEEIAASGTSEDRERLRHHVRVCIDDLSGLLVRLESDAGAEMRKT